MSMIPAKESERSDEELRPSAEIVAMSRPQRGFARIQAPEPLPPDVAKTLVKGALRPNCAPC